MKLPDLVKVTLYSRSNCSLCDNARHAVYQIRKRRPFTFRLLDVMKPANAELRIYEFDVPVIMVEPLQQPKDGMEVKQDKIMHKIEETQLEALIDKVEKSLKAP